MSGVNQNYSGTIPNFINGVSQQAIAVRLASQCEAQENGFSSIVDGMGKRPPTEYVAKLSDSLLGGCHIHTINRDTQERYLVLTGNGWLQVYDLVGKAFRTVNAPHGWSYLSAANPATAMSAVTVADHTFIVNKTFEVGTTSGVSETRPYEAMVWVKQGAYSCTYKVYVEGNQVAAYTVPDGSIQAHNAFVQTDFIADQLYTQMTSIMSSYGYTLYRVGSVIYFSRTSADFSVTVSDGLSGTALKMTKGTIQRFSDLPEKAIGGFVVKIVGDQSSKFDGYYVRYDDNASTATGTWTETARPGMKIALEPASMPHLLVREADGTFTFRKADWEPNKVGDEDTSPWPSFVGRAIGNVFFHRDRLGFITDENVTMSRAGSYFNFFRQTTTQLLDSDPVDIGTNHTKVSILRHAIPFDRELILFSDQTQFVLTAGDLLTPKTASVVVSTEFECSPDVAPALTGRSIMFATPRGSSTAIRELFTDTDTGSYTATDITGHVPKYVPAGAFKVAVNTVEGVMLVLCASDPNAVFVHQWFWSGNEKIQNAWHRWTFPGYTRVLNADFIDSTAYIVAEKSDGKTYLESVSMEPSKDDPGKSYTLHLDSRVASSALAKSYSAATDRTTFTVPYGGAVAALVVAETGSNGTRPGQYFALQHDGPGVFSLKGDHRVTVGWIGVPYTLRYRLSPLLVRVQSSNGGALAVQSGRLQLRSITFSHENTGYYLVTVKPSGARDECHYPFTPRFLGEAVLGEITISSGTHRVPIMARNTDVSITIENDSPLPCSILSAEWEGLFVKRGGMN